MDILSWIIGRSGRPDLILRKRSRPCPDQTKILMMSTPPPLPNQPKLDKYAERLGFSPTGDTLPFSIDQHIKNGVTRKSMRYKLAVWTSILAAPFLALWLILNKDQNNQVWAAITTALIVLTIDLTIYRIARWISDGILREDLRKFYWNVANVQIGKKPPHKMFLSALLNILGNLFTLYCVGRLCLLLLVIIVPIAVIFFPGVVLIIILMIVGIGYTIRFIGEVWEDSKWEMLKVSMLPKIARNYY